MTKLYKLLDEAYTLHKKFGKNKVTTLEAFLVYAHVKNKYFASLMLILVSASFNAALATQRKAWSKDNSGRVLIYRAEPSTLEVVNGGFSVIMALSFLYIGLYPGINNLDRVIKKCCTLLGIFYAGFGIYVLEQLHHEYDSLHKPLVAIDRWGIVYEGKDKILWRNVCRYRRVGHIVFTNNGLRYWHGLEITSDVDTLQIYENKIAITLDMLCDLVDESYDIYKTSKNKKWHQ